MNISADHLFAQNGLQRLGYTQIEPLYKGMRTGVYRAWETDSAQSIIIKCLNHDYPSFGELVQFRNQYTITKNLSIPGIVKPLGLEAVGNSYALLMEDVGGVALSRYVQQQTLDVAEILAIALHLTDILHNLHQQRVIHKDIKPANILIHPESKQVWLIDFSIASLLPKETQAIQSPKSLEGTLAYLAPEQTGRMNRAIDYRTDFYALGITLYELLTGQLPFASDDPLELIHHHMTTQPPLAHALNPDVPPILSEIIAKLMAKNAEDRYQSALGLKWDLERCREEWQDKGTRIWFQIGERDVSDRFLIPEKLYGRHNEVMALLEAFNRASTGQTELMLVAGFSGIGKTAVINEIHKPIVRQRGYFIKGKFDQFNRNIPFSAFVQAFRDLIGQLLGESDVELTHWKTKILEAVGNNGQVLIEVIPELESVIGKQPPAPELSGSAAQNRFNLLFEKFIAVFTTPDHPLVLFLDDLQWADSASLNLMKVLMGDSNRGYLLLLGAYRDNEVFPAHPLVLSLDELEKQGANLHTLTLQPLGISDINHLVADTLLCDPDVALPLSQLVYQKTKGNPFFTAQFLRGLPQEDCITFNREAGYWQCDLTQVRQLALTDDVVEFMVSRLQKLPQATQDVLKMAACIGNQFDLATLAIVCEHSQEEVSTDLWRSLQEGLVIPKNETYKFFQGDAVEVTKVEDINVGYRFLHDRVQQAAYLLIPDEKKCRTHYGMGRLLLNHYSEDEQEQYIFDIVTHLNAGRSLILEAKEQKQFAQLNLTAGQKALASTAYEAAIEYLETGLECLGPEAWRSAYALTLDLYKNLGSAQLSSVKHEQLKSTLANALPEIIDPIDRSDLYVFQVDSYSIQGQYSEAIEIGILGLKELGSEIDREKLDEFIQLEKEKINNLLGDRNVYSLLDLNTTVPAKISAEIKLLISIDPPTYIIGDINLYSAVSLRAAYLSIKHGNVPASVKSYANYGVLLGLMEQKYDRGYQFADMAIQLAQKLNSKSQECQAGLLLGYWIHVWGRHISGAAEVNYSSFVAGIDSGEIQFAAYNLFASILNRLFQGENLAEIDDDINKYWLISNKLKDDSLRISLAGSYIFINQLLLNQEDGKRYTLISNPEKIIHDGEVTNSWMAVSAYYILRMHLACLKGQFSEGLEYTQKAKAVLNGTVGSTTYSAYFFYMSLILLNVQPDLSSDEQNDVWEQIQANQKQLRFWAESCPENFLHKYSLVEAEKYRVLDQKLKAIDLYDHAISEAKANGFMQEEALANELAAKFYLDWGKEKIAAVYMQEAYYGYSRWGAKAKVTDLETCYPNLLRPILRSSAASGDMWATLITITSATASPHTSTHHNSSSTSLNQTLDFASILQASQALSGTIHLDELLQQLTQIILQNSGGDRCALIIPNETGEWQVRALAQHSQGEIANLEQTHLCAEALTGHPNLPVKLIQYVKNTQDAVVINDLDTDLPVVDDYCLQQQPKSILCLPIINQGHIIGILYLRNQLTSGVFTEERILVLNFLCTQAAISLENARLYQKVEQSLTDLEQAQLQIVQSEKMSALGNLVAGVAHEINNPVGCILGNVGATQEYINDLLGIIDLYADQFPEPGTDIEEELDAVDLDYVRDDLPQLIRAMKDSGDRIKSISRSLRTFSRADTDQKQLFNLHDGIDSTVLILRHRLKANELRPEIEVVTGYGDIPEIHCFPGQLNQVFMNILANAIDVLDETSQRRSLDDLKANPNRITIRTSVEDNQVTIAIADNGPGIPEEIKAQIFDHLFTTKKVGKGTGLGLAIAHQIVVDTHNGCLDVKSEVGQGSEFCIKLPVVPNM